MTGAAIQLSDGTPESYVDSIAPVVEPVVKLDPAGAESLVMSAKAGTGAGTWIDRFGSKVETIKDDQGVDVQKTKSIELRVPKSTAKDAVEYRTKLTWKLTDVPGNK